MKNNTETRERLINISKDGRGADNFRISLPAKWLRDMGISYDKRNVKIVYDSSEKKIIIEKI
ncbi:AbrB/MazE/SpoVT family DNA-binding domain-containing protein [Sebaldella termitidis]|uniref:AbrB/MazE/SpoVT family DNA-binding domain-containing protein n=1 Tax=Sebaldella termitidis TaxID=826 RepID=UPI003EBB2B49